MAPVPLARVVRSGLEESVHLGDVAVVDVDGRVVARAGDPERRMFARSAMKPLQAAVSLSLAGTEFTDPEVAVMCASHNAEPVHLRAVRSILGRGGVPEAELRCPAVLPRDEGSALGAGRRAVNSDCSGKHAGMLVAAAARGWPLATYREPGHPVQRAVLSWVRGASGEDVHVGVDGCGVPVHGMALRAMATVYARLASAGSLGDLAAHAARAVAAMRAEPYMVAGRDRVETALMGVAPVVVKGGAEGLLCAASPDRGLGIAVKVRDGHFRAAGPALIRTLRLLDLMSQEQVAAVDRFARPAVLGGGRPVGQIVSRFSLEAG